MIDDEYRPPNVTLESYDCGKFKVFINGKHMETVQKFNISGDIGECPLVKLEFIADVNIK
jgi:hypothetical protein